MKNFFILTFLIFFAIGVFTYTQLSKVEKVLKITSPFEIYIDKNRNLIFDEKNPISLTSIFYVNENTDLNKFPKLKVLSDDEKFILKYLALEKCKHLLEDKHIKLKNNHIYIHHTGHDVDPDAGRDLSCPEFKAAGKGSPQVHRGRKGHGIRGRDPRFKGIFARSETEGKGMEEILQACTQLQQGISLCPCRQEARRRGRQHNRRRQA